MLNPLVTTYADVHHTSLQGDTIYPLRKMLSCRELQPSLRSAVWSHMFPACSCLFLMEFLSYAYLLYMLVSNTRYILSDNPVLFLYLTLLCAAGNVHI